MFPTVHRRREARHFAESGGRGREVMLPQRRLERVALGGEPRRRLGAEMPGLAAALMRKLNIRRTREDGWAPGGRGRCGRETGDRSYPAGPAPSMGSLATTSVARLKTLVVPRGNSNAWTEVGARNRVRQFPAAR